MGSTRVVHINKSIEFAEAANPGGIPEGIILSGRS